MKGTSDLIINADIAFENKQYDEALKWYKKAIEEDGDNLYALSRAGAICIPLGMFDDAFSFFERAKSVDPNNGDNHFNYGNACFFKNKYKDAFDSYLEAESVGCSNDVLPRLYFQMALVCNLRQDIKASLIYFDKCEKVDGEGVITLSADYIFEKLKLLMITKDYENAEKQAKRLVSIQPSVFKNYMIYFSITMAHKNYVSAELILKQALEYAKLSSDDIITLALQESLLYVEKANNDINSKKNYFDKAIEILKEKIQTNGLRDDQKLNLYITLAEVYLKYEKYQNAISCLESILVGDEYYKSEKRQQHNTLNELSVEEIEKMIQKDIFSIQESISQGKLNPDLGAYASAYISDKGQIERYYDESIFRELYKEECALNQVKYDSKRGIESISLEVREKIYFTFLSCYLGMDDYVNALKYASILRYSKNTYYNYYGLYVSTMLYKKINGDNGQSVKKYVEAIAFFRNRTISNRSDNLAIIYRSRLYAEKGDFDKARELAKLLTESDSNNLLEYIEQCQKQMKGNK